MKAVNIEIATNLSCPRRCPGCNRSCDVYPERVEEMSLDQIDRFIDLHDVRRSLPLHELREGESYVLGAFLVGAYQETLGDLHNLLGDTHVVSIRHDERGHLEFTREIAGDTVADVLSYVEYSPKELVERMRRKAERAVRAGDIDVRQRRRILDAYQAGLRGYTYYEEDADA